ncbi:MAG: hypothetical protein IPJ81_05990 [Chitinophagaceae bacterium]|nr:hypothetical protein [Chitinophagaceae bacterium]
MSLKILQICIMLSKQKNSAQIGFYSSFEEQLNHSHPLYILANRIDWNVFEEALKNITVQPRANQASLSA